MNRTKTSPESFGFYRRWEKALLAADIELPKGCTKMGLWAYCTAMAVKGTNGIDCYAGDDTIRQELGIYNRRDIAKYRHLAIELGWFEPTGKRHGRAEGLTIAIPTVRRVVEVPAPRKPAESKPAVVEASEVLEQDPWATDPSNPFAQVATD